MDTKWLLGLPKLDLHCHLDGSMDPETIAFLLKDQGLDLKDGQSDYENLKSMLQVSSDCTSLTEYLEKFDLPLSCLRTEKGLDLASYELLRNSAKENVKYMEIRFAPGSSVTENLTYEKVMEAVLSGIKKAEKDFAIKAQVIVCAMRHNSLESNIAMLKVAKNYHGEGVCALDLAGDETAYPTIEQKELFLTAKKLEIPFTIHSGECGSVKNVRDAIEIGAKRLGHGIALVKDKELMKTVKRNRVGIEMCPTSNFQTKAVTSWREYPLDEFLNQGLLATINTDNRTVSNTTVTNELLKVHSYLGIDEDSIIKLMENSIEIAFAEDNVKHILLKEIRNVK